MSGWRWYKKMLETNPMATKSITAGILMGTSDVLSQSFEQATGVLKQQKRLLGATETDPLVFASPSTSIEALHNFSSRYDWTRSMHVTITGLTLIGPLTHTWYNMLERIVVWSIPRMPILAVGAVPQLVYRMFLDAVIYSPVGVGGYFVWRTQLEGGSLASTWNKLQLVFPQALVASWSFWPAANIVNFTLVPLPFRVLYTNLLSLFWNAYLSTVNSRSCVQDSSAALVLDEV
ncbi:unnamed protein product [Cylindrotheca closterium]|uniref:Peroxisomal membrane protein MPV17 n=1 Tax=Cylindrotheca closterium TaxID=2856 RepID=A0AAD2FGF0_9STRA|nr:unnamed protein product [Cylindrotheca closterium]